MDIVRLSHPTLYDQITRLEIVIQSIFERMDTNSNGILNKNEVATFLSEISSENHKKRKERAKTLVHGNDEDGDYGLNRLEFRSCVIHGIHDGNISSVLESLQCLLGTL
jgi:Ca2+-binding EF-hand superfamily protein